jgi:hypothetical protein
MKHPGPLWPESPKNNARWRYDVFLTVVVAVAWLLLFLLVEAKLISQTALLIAVIVTVPIVTLVASNPGWYQSFILNVFGRREPLPPAVDIRSIWPTEPMPPRGRIKDAGPRTVKRHLGDSPRTGRLRGEG